MTDNTKDAQSPEPNTDSGDMPDYVLEEQFGFLFRIVNQRYLKIFSELMIEDLTPAQFFPLVKLLENGPCSQNQLGREAAVDSATIKGVIERLNDRGLVEIVPDPDDARRHLIKLTDEALVKEAVQKGHQITARTLEPLNPEEWAQLISLLSRLK
jgi:DNA-binding MarR family transcriptional regulator